MGDGGNSTWGWAQNSLVSVDTTAKTFRYNHEYYLLKHLSHFVDAGAKTLSPAGTCDEPLAFLNPDGAIVAVVRNVQSTAQMVQVRERDVGIELPPDSVATLAVRPA